MSEDVATDVGQHLAEQAAAPAEKMLSQSEVDRIVGAAKAKERQQAEAYYRSQMQQSPMQQQSHVGMGGVAPSFDRESLLEEARNQALQTMQSTLQEERERAERERVQGELDKVAKDYAEKMKIGKSLYEDFDQVTKSFKPGKFPQIGIWAAQQDNTAAIVYDLAKNPQKLAQLHILALTDPELAVDEITKLSQSIKRNEEAVNQNVKSPQPLSKLKPSVVAGTDNGKMSVADLRKQPWLRA